MAINFIPPAKDASIKVVSLGVAFYKEPSANAEKALKIGSKFNTYTAWQIGDTVKALGNTITNTDGTWIEAQHFRWYRKNFLSAWFPILLTVYYRVEDGTATWLSDSVIGGKPNNTGTGSIETGTGNGTGSGSGTPAPEEKTDKTLQYIGLAIGATSLFLSLNKK